MKTRTLEECWEEISRKTQTHQELTPLIAEFVGVTENRTVTKWFTGKRLPIGPNLVKLMHFVAMLGYKVKELEEMDSSVRLLSECFGFGVIDQFYIQREITFFSWDHVLRMMRGAIGTTKATSIYESVKVCKPFMLSNKEVWQARIRNFTLTSDESAPVFEMEVSPSKKKGLTNEKILEVLAHQLQSILPLAKQVGSDEFSPEERATLRKLSGRETIFELKNVLVRLCGERAYRDLG